MNWNECIEDFSTHLKLEKSLSPLSIGAYLNDIKKLENHIRLIRKKATPLEKITSEDPKLFLEWLNETGISATSQARIVSGIKAFYRYMLDISVILTPWSGFNSKNSFRLTFLPFST